LKSVNEAYCSEAYSALFKKTDKLILLLLVGMVLLCVIWAYLCPIDRIVRAEGRIIAAGRPQIVQHLEGGIVTQINVREGQYVKAGDVIVRLSDIQATSVLQQGQTRLWSLKAQQARMQAEVEGRYGPSFNKDIPQEIQESEQAAFRERLARQNSEKKILNQQITQRQSELTEAKSRANNLSTELELSKKLTNTIDGLFKNGAASKLELLEAQGRTERLITTYSEVMSSIPRLQSAIVEMVARLEESKDKFRADVRSELSDVSAEIARIEYAVGGDSDRLSRTEVRAPVNGYINRLYFNTIGGVAKPGEHLLEITPNDGVIAVEARVNPDDRASLRPGLESRVIIGAYDYAIYGSLPGKLIEVSADTLPDEQGHHYYRVQIETKSADEVLAKQSILPGMTARADIVLGQRNVLSYLLSPLARFKHEAFREPN
jgi:adhesin transport system membrane fusion protein